MGQSTEELTTQIEGTREDLASNLDALHDRVSPQAVIERRKSAARSRMYRVRNRVMGSAYGVRRNTSDTASSAVDTVEEKFEGSPLAAGLMAFGAGMLVSALLPATETEARAAGKVVETAKEHGQPVMDEAKSMGQEIGQQMKESATQAAQDVKDTATQSAQHVKAEGQTSAQQVQQEAKHQTPM